MSNAELKNEIPSLVSRLIQLPSVNPPGYTINVASFIRDWLSERGFTSETKEYAKDKPNVIARVGRGGRPVLILNGHMDVVPPAMSPGGFTHRSRGGRSLRVGSMVGGVPRT